MSNQQRQPAGVPVGGQYATSTREESGVRLGHVAEDVPADEATLNEAEVSYEFPAWKATAAIASIEKANRRAERAGIAERFDYSIETWEVRTKDPHTGFDVVEDRARLTLDRPTLQHDGWTFAATLTWDDEAGMISRGAPGAVLLERPTERLCDVCGKQRDRKDTYVVQRTEPDGTRVQMQVGSDCLDRFMGIRPAGLWMLDFDPDVTDDPDDEHGGEAHMRRTESRRDSAQMIGLGLAVVEQNGWVPRSAASENRRATADLVLSALYMRPRTDVDKRWQADLLARGTAIAETGEPAEVLAYARDVDGASDYATNLRAIAGAESVTDRNLPLLLSAIAASRRAKEKAAEHQARSAQRSADAATSQWIGKEKDKISDVTVTVTGTHVTENYYGRTPTYTTIVSMKDDDGNVWKWFASGAKEDVIKPGMRATMAGTIKGHGEWQGVKETTVTRAKLVALDASGDADQATPSVEAVPAADPDGPYADLHTTHELLARWNRQVAQWTRSGQNVVKDLMAERESTFDQRYTEVQEALRERAAAATPR